MNLRLCAWRILCIVAAGVACLVAPGRADTLDTLSVPEGFSVTRAAGPPLTSYPMFMTFDDEGRLFIAESTGKDLSGQEMAAAPECLILRLTDEDGDGVYDGRTVFADTLSLPMGVLWHQDALYVASPPEFVRFTDTDDDGVADTREVLLTGWNVFNTASLHGPYLGPDGLLYLTHGRHGYDITTQEGVRLEGLASRIWRCKPDGSQLERFAGGGFDNPVEIIFTPGAEMIGTMTYFTDPQLGQRDGIMHWVWGGVYPKPHPSVEEFIRTGDLMPVVSKYARIAPSGLAQYRSGAFGEDYTGDLFSAQFNPHRVQRHKLIRDGATFRTEDSDFLTSTNADFYPTDVLEDADGSLLVSDTGAWYVDACPISRVAKPEVRGGIYRITRDDATATADVWGHDIAWADLADAACVNLLRDTRFRVRDRAVQECIARGKRVLPVIDMVAQNAARPEARIAALSTRYQIAPDGNVAPFVAALSDETLAVRLAALRHLGDLGNPEAVGAISALLGADDSAIRREAATALGRIGDASAVPTLLDHAKDLSDRFVDHAFIYALIELGDIETLAEALADADAPWDTRKAALIALDQLGYEALQAEHVLPFLRTEDAGMRHAGLWVAEHHPDWAGDILSFVEDRLRAAEEEAALVALRDSVLAYLPTDAGEAFVARLVADETAGTMLRRFLLQCLEADTRDTLPAAWQTALTDCLKGSDAELRQQTLALIRARNLAGFQPTLRELAADADQPDTLRLGALAALLQQEVALEETQIAYALEGLRPEADPAVRRAAAVVLGAADLSEAVRLQLVNDYLPEADSLTMATVLSSVEGSEDAALGHALVDTLLAHPEVLRLVSQVQIQTALRAFPDAVQQAAEALEARVSAGADETLARFLKLEPQLGRGDVGRGRELFFDQRAQCSVCHAVGTEGGRLGPDLTTIGLVRSGHDLLEAILFPNASMVPDYVPHVVELDWETLTGIIKNESDASVTLATAVDAARHVPRDEIVSIHPSTVSMMPEGLDASLSDQELVDLVTFLQSLNNQRWLLPEQRNDG
jgi:putative membrane-bound dehydrogenase-like protein